MVITASDGDNCMVILHGSPVVGGEALNKGLQGAGPRVRILFVYVYMLVVWYGYV